MTANNIRKSRKAKGIKQIEIAKMLGYKSTSFNVAVRRKSKGGKSMIDKIGKLEHLAYNIHMRTHVAQELSNRSEIETYMKGYRTAQKHTAENIIEYANELMQLVEEIKAEMHKGYLYEDVDLNGMAVDEYA